MGERGQVCYLACGGKVSSTEGAPPTHLIQTAQARDMCGVCQGYLLCVHGLILPHGLLHSHLHGLELLWGQRGLVGWEGKDRPTGSQPHVGKRCIKRQSLKKV